MSRFRDSAEEPSGDPATEASDALSLHTIADDQADAYAAQEQEDADFALALALEDEESRNVIESQRQSQVHSDGQSHLGDLAEVEAFPPYHDNPDAEDHLDDGLDTLTTPYRDDPDAVPTDSEANADAESAAAPPRRQRGFVRRLKGVGKTWLCLAAAAAIFSILIAAVIVIVLRVSGWTDAHNRAWRDSRSRDGDLRLTELYPALEDGAERRCKELWEKSAASLRCHRMVLSSVWDDGDVGGVNAVGADPFAYDDEICTDQCHSQISGLRQNMDKWCYRRTDRFDLVSYGNDGRAYFEKAKVEEGPYHAAEALMGRYNRICARPPRREKTEWRYCAADVWMRWGIVDGKNEANMNGVDSFLERTNEKRTVEGGERSGEVPLGGGVKKKYVVQVPTRKFGPGDGETDCGYCTLDWMERKMNSFEYGQILDATSGKPLGLSEFSEKMHTAIKRCEVREGDLVLDRVHAKWEKYRWWCDDKPCQEDRTVIDEVREVLHGMHEEDWPLPELRKLMKKPDASGKAFRALHDGMRNLPCSIWLSQGDLLNEVIPYQHVVEHLCSDRCRNAVDRLEQEHGKDFAAASGDVPPANIFKAWDFARDQVNRTCLNNYPNRLVQDNSPTFCAPGYAAIGHPEWILEPNPPKSEILSAFTTAMDKLAAELPRHVEKPEQSSETQRINWRITGESACNVCAGELLIGKTGQWTERIAEFMNDETIDSGDYANLVKKGFITCAKMLGVELSWAQKKAIWHKIGLDQFDY